MEVFLKKYFEKIIIRILLLTMICSIFASLTLFYMHTAPQQAMLSREISSRSSEVGKSIAFVISKAVQIGIPYDSMVGVPEFLNETINKSKDLDYLSITDLEGNTIYSSSDLQPSLKGSFKRFALSVGDSNTSLTPFPIASFFNIPIKIVVEGKPYGYLHLGVSEKVTKDSLNDIYYDILTILFISMIAGLEFFLFIFRNKVQLTMKNLVLTMQRITNRDFRRFTHTSEGDGIGLATSKLNSIIESISRKRDQLKVKIDNLVGDNTQFSMLRDSYTKAISGVQFSQSSTLDKEKPSPVIENLRLPAFLLVLAETILVAILPSYASQFYDPEMGVSKSFISGSPVLAFMIFSTVGILLSRKVSNVMGFKKAILAGLLLATLGYLIAFVTNGLSFMLITRAITAIGYGISYAAFQNYIVAHAQNKVTSYAVFAVAFGAAYICGAPLGGILVDNVGYSYTFLNAGISTIIALWFVRAIIVDAPYNSEETIQKTRLNPSALIKDKSFMITLIFAGLPSRFIFASLVCLFLPLYLRSLGYSQSYVGRNLMIYGIVMFAFSTIAAKIIDKLKLKTPQLLFLSTFLIGISILILALDQISIAPKIALFSYAIMAVIHVCAMMSYLDQFSEKVSESHSRETVLSFYFIAERIGMILGPVLVTYVLNFADFEVTIYALTSFIVLCSVVYGAHHLFSVKNLKNFIAKEARK
jgi:predicted MFS family arabinose efflux permease